METLEILQQATKTGFHLLGMDQCNSGGILGFETPLFSKFLREKRLTGDFWKDEVYNDDPFRDGLSLVVDVDAQDDLWNYEPPENLDQFISNMYLAYYDSLPELNLVFASPHSLHHLLPLYSDYFIDRGITPLGNISKKPCGPDVKPQTAKWLIKERELSKRVYVCDYKGPGFDRRCDEPMCQSDFTWIKNGVSLIYFYSGGGDILLSAWIYPFVTDCFERP